MGATPWTTTSSASPATSAGEMSHPAKTPWLSLHLPALATKKGVHPPGCTLQLILGCLLHPQIAARPAFSSPKCTQDPNLLGWPSREEQM